jgi:ankyrin repeat protein
LPGNAPGVVGLNVVMPATELREAIDHGDVPRVRQLLRAEPALATALIAAPDIEPTSPLTYVGMVRFYGYADHERTGELAKVLMQAGADKDDETKNGSPLICAASHGDAAVVSALLAAGADVELSDADAPTDTALRVAAAYGFPEIVDQLIAAGAKINSVIEAAGAGDLTDWPIAELSDFERACALRAAAVNERLTIIDQLLAAGTPVDAEVDGHSAIHWAREQGRSRAVEHLARRGATPQR